MILLHPDFHFFNCRDFNCRVFNCRIFIFNCRVFQLQGLQDFNCRIFIFFNCRACNKTLSSSVLLQAYLAGRPGMCWHCWASAGCLLPPELPPPLIIIKIHNHHHHHHHHHHSKHQHCHNCTYCNLNHKIVHKHTHQRF